MPIHIAAEAFIYLLDGLYSQIHIVFLKGLQQILAYLYRAFVGKDFRIIAEGHGKDPHQRIGHPGNTLVAGIVYKSIPYIRIQPDRQRRVLLSAGEERIYSFL